MTDVVHSPPFAVPTAGTTPRSVNLRRLVPYLLVAPLLIYMLVLYALPVVTMLLRSVNDPTWTLAHYAALAEDPVFIKTFGITFNISITVTLPAS